MAMGRGKGPAETVAAAETVPARAGATVAARTEGNTALDASLRSPAVAGYVTRHGDPTAQDWSRYDEATELARGGLGRVMVARDRRLGGRVVAIKQLLNASPRAALRFRREALLTARLQHPGIVPLYEIGTDDDGEPYYAMKLVEGRPFDALLAGAGDLTARIALLPSVLAVADAIAYAHGEGVIHRDLKPGNVLVGAFGETVVVDWGLAKQIGERDESLDDSSIPIGDLTAAGDVMGTPSYMAPEQAAGDDVDERADVYALGAILYHVLCGARPYPGPTGEAVLSQLLAGPPPALATRVRGVPPDLVTIVERAMARSPADRYRTARELAADLRRFQTGQLVEAHRYTVGLLLRRWLWRHRWLVSVAGVLMVALAATAIVSVRSIVRERNRVVVERDLANRRSEDLVLSQARSALERDPTTAVAWLAELGDAIARRGPEVRALVVDAQSRLVARHVLREHTRSVAYLAFTADGRALLSAGLDGRLDVWSLKGPRPHLLSRVLHGAALQRSASLADGRIVSAGANGAVRVWPAPSMDRSAWRASIASTAGQRTLWRHHGNAKVRTMGEVLVSSGEDGEVLAGTVGSRPHVVAQYRSPVTATALAPGGWIASGDATGIVVLGRLDAAGARISSVELSHPAAIHELALSPDGQLLATACADRTVRIWRTAGGPVAHSIALAGESFDLTFSPDGRRLAIVDLGGGIQLVDVETLRSEAIPSHGKGAFLVRFSPDGQWLVTVASEGGARLWNLHARVGWQLRGQHGDVQTLAFSPDSRMMATGANDGTVRLWPMPRERADADLVLAGEVRSVVTSRGAGTSITVAGDIDGNVSIRRDGAASIAFTMDGAARGLAVTRDGHVVVAADKWGGLWRWQDGAGARKLGTHAPEVHAVALSPDERWAATAGNAAVGLWPLAAGDVRWLPAPGRVQTVTFAADGSVVSGELDGTIRWFDARGGDGRVLVRLDQGVNRLAVSPDGAQLAIGGTSGLLAIWDVAAGTLRELHRHGAQVSSLSFARDGQRLLATSWDGTSTIADVATGRVVALRGHQGQVNMGVFAAAGDAVATVADDGSVRVWNLDGTVRRVLRAGQSYLLRIAAASDDSFVAVGGNDGAIVRWYDAFAPFSEADAPAVPSLSWLEAISSARIQADESVRTPDRAN